MSQPQAPYSGKVSPETMLDPELVADIQRISARINDLDYELGNEKWIIAGRVNEMWTEHKGIYDNVEAYRAECSRIANAQNKRKLFSTSGETLKRWCQVRATYNEYEHAELFLTALSFDHLAKAKSIYLSEKVKSPLVPLALAEKNNWSADEMEFHYNNNPVTVSIGAKNTLTNLMNKIPKLLNWDKEKTANFTKRVNELIQEFLG